MESDVNAKMEEVSLARPRGPLRPSRLLLAESLGRAPTLVTRAGLRADAAVQTVICSRHVLVCGPRQGLARGAAVALAALAIQAYWRGVLAWRAVARLRASRCRVTRGSGAAVGDRQTPTRGAEEGPSVPLRAADWPLSRGDMIHRLVSLGAWEISELGRELADARARLSAFGILPRGRGADFQVHEGEPCEEPSPADAAEGYRAVRGSSVAVIPAAQADDPTDAVFDDIVRVTGAAKPNGQEGEDFDKLVLLSDPVTPPAQAAVTPPEQAAVTPPGQAAVMPPAQAAVVPPEQAGTNLADSVV